MSKCGQSVIKGKAISKADPHIWAVPQSCMLVCMRDIENSTPFLDSVPCNKETLQSERLPGLWRIWVIMQDW